MTVAISPSVEPRLRSLAQELTLSLRKDAKAAKWPTNVANSLSVVIVDQKIQISYPTKMAKQIEDLEYGSNAGFANPVLRKFTTSNERLIDSTVVEAISDYVMSSEVLL